LEEEDKDLELEIKDIESTAEKLIQLDNQIILCLDTPEPSVYDALMSIISQNTERDQQYSFVGFAGYRHFYPYTHFFFCLVVNGDLFRM
jgi:hypothetical protein